jgi:glutamate formiminotransferase
MRKLVECVPNFSEGRDRAAIDSIAAALRSVSECFLLDRTSDRDHNRSVFTLAGQPEAVSSAILRGAEVAVRRIDLRKHVGVHPRIGAIDVVPFVPVENLSQDECVELARDLGRKFWEEFKLPVYFYGDAALRDGRRRLETIRRGGFEALREAALEDPSRRPDLGGPGLHPSAGASAVGVRKFLIAYNVQLAGPDPAAARQIAMSIRESSGGFRHVKALGLALAHRGLSQVSMNFTDFEVTPPHVVVAEIKRLAAKLETQVVGGELIGLIPRRALEMAAGGELPIDGFSPSMVLENRLAEAMADLAGG